MIIFLPLALVFLLSTSCSSLENKEQVKQEDRIIFESPGNLR